MGNRKSEVFDVEGISVEIGAAMSKDSGLVVVARNIRSALWFRGLVGELLDVMASSSRRFYGFKSKPKLEAGLVALLSGLTMGRRNPSAIAVCFALDPLWKGVVGRSFSQRELSRLMEVLTEVGREPLRRALLASALGGQDALELDMDSSLLELHGEQEGGAYNGHYHAFGYHTGWAFDVRTARIAAIWHNEGNAHTADGQPEQLTWILDQGTKVTMARFDAGLINPRMLQAIDGRVGAFVCRIRPNDVLERLSDPIEPDGTLYAGARSYGEIRYAAASWEKDQRVVVKFQAPEGADGQAALFPERYYFVTSLEATPADVVRIYQQRGESERVFGEFTNTFGPTFRHARKDANEAWAQLLALAHNVLSGLRELLPKEEIPLKVRVEYKPAFLPDAWVFGYHRWVDGATKAVRPLLSRVRDMALRVPCELRQRGQSLRLIVSPDILQPTWFPALLRS